jgi:hypothetical protein
MEAVEKERQMLEIRAVVAPGDSLAAEALAEDMTAEQRDAYFRLICKGDHFRSAASVVTRTKDEHLLELIRQTFSVPAIRL